jgi:hypothetical protein
VNGRGAGARIQRFILGWSAAEVLLNAQVGYAVRGTMWNVGLDTWGMRVGASGEAQ